MSEIFIIIDPIKHPGSEDVFNNILEYINENSHLSFFVAIHDDDKNKIDERFSKFEKIYKPEEIAQLNSVTKCFFAGGAFEICVRNRPLGYQWFVENTKVDIFTNPKWLISTTGDYPNLSTNVDWIETNNTNIYKYHRAYG